jgi:hypothetical protein
MEIDLLAKRHLWAMGALAAGAFGMFIAALATGEATRPVDIWILALARNGNTLTRMACATVR